MKIVRVEAVPLSIPCRYGAEGWTLGAGGWKALEFCLVRVDTDAGITGWGEAFSYSCRRAAVPSDAALLLDVNCEWGVEEAIAVGRRLAPMGLGWFEEPVFPPENGTGLRAVGEASGIPIAAGENCCFATQFAALFDAGAVQYAQPSVTKVGGVTEFRKVAALAAQRGVKLAPHSPYFGPGALATLHLVAALAPEARFEYFYLQADAWLYGDLLAPRHGELKVPQGPGLGTDPDPDVVRRYRVE